MVQKKSSDGQVLQKFLEYSFSGSDALVNIWDPFNRKRICQLHKLVY